MNQIIVRAAPDFQRHEYGIDRPHDKCGLGQYLDLSGSWQGFKGGAVPQKMRVVITAMAGRGSHGMYETL